RRETPGTKCTRDCRRMLAAPGGGYESQHAAAETTAGHAGRDRACGDRRLDRNVDFVTRNPEIIPHRRLRGSEQCGEHGEVAAFEGGCCLADPGDLSNDVAGEWSQVTIQSGFHRICGRVPQRRYAELFRGLNACPAPSGVSAGGVRMHDPRVDDDET